MVAVSGMGDIPPLQILEVAASDLAGCADALSDIFAGRLTGIVIRQAFPQDALEGVVRRLEAADFGLERQSSPHFKGETYGRVLIVGDRDLADYFREAARFSTACKELFSGAPAFQDRVESLLGEVAGGRDVRVPSGPDGSSYAPATIRGLTAGGEIDLHCENETVDFPSMWHLAEMVHARNQLSYYVLLAQPEGGGELVVHNARFAEGHGAMLGHMERDAAALEAIAPYGQVVPHTAVGDLLVFDSGRYFHRVTPVVGPRFRWTMGGFLARSHDDRTVHYWS